MLNRLDKHFFPASKWEATIRLIALEDLEEKYYSEESLVYTEAEWEAMENALFASTGCIDPVETPEPQNPMLQAWIRHCRLPLGSTRPGSKLGLPFDPTIPIGQGKSEALLKVANIDHRFGGAK